AVHAGATLARDAQPLAVGDTLGHAGADRFRHAPAYAVGADLRHCELEAELGAARRVLQIDACAHLVVLARHGEVGAAAPAGEAAAGLRPELGEQVGEIDVVQPARTEARFPVGRRTEFLAGLVAAQLVV